MNEIVILDATKTHGIANAGSEPVSYMVIVSGQDAGPEAVRAEKSRRGPFEYGRNCTIIELGITAKRFGRARSRFRKRSFPEI
jgi:hypothetical protein